MKAINSPTNTATASNNSAAMNVAGVGTNSNRKLRFHDHSGGKLGTSNKVDANIDDPATAVGRLNLLERDLERRQESYVARERAFKTRIDELEEEIAALRQVAPFVLILEHLITVNFSRRRLDG